MFLKPGKGSVGLMLLDVYFVKKYYLFLKKTKNKAETHKPSYPMGESDYATLHSNILCVTISESPGKGSPHW